MPTSFTRDSPPRCLETSWTGTNARTPRRRVHLRFSVLPTRSAPRDTDRDGVCWRRLRHPTAPVRSWIPTRPHLACAWGRSVAQGREVCQSPQAQSREPNRYLGSRAARTLLGCLLGCGPFQGGNRASQLHRCQRRVAVMPESLPAPHLASCIGRAPSVFGASASQCSMFRSASVRFPYAAVTFLLVGFRGAGALSSSLDVIDEHPPLPARRSRAQLLKAPAFRSLCSPFGHACSQFLVQFGNTLPWTPGNNGGRGLDTSLDSS